MGSGGSRLNASPYQHAIRDGLRDALLRDEDVLLLGEDVGHGSPETAGLQQEFGDWRVLDAPHAQGAIVGAATGLALAGLRPIAQLDRPLEASAEIATAARAGARVVLRVRAGHDEAPPEMVVAAAASAHDARGLLEAALSHDGPVLLLEDGRCEAPASAGACRLGEAEVRREGSDLTALSWGIGVQHALAAAERCDGSVEVIDLRTLVPLDLELVLASCARTSKVVVLGLGRHAERIAAAVGEAAFAQLDGPPTIAAPTDADAALAAFDHLIHY